ncbi:hypothetical protein D3C80_1992370 [compost metagenome]
MHFSDPGLTLAQVDELIQDSVQILIATLLEPNLLAVHPSHQAGKRITNLFPALSNDG